MSIILAGLGGVLGAAVGWLMVAALAMLAGNFFGFSDHEGALAMQSIFTAGPAGGAVGLILGIWLTLRARGRAGLPAAVWRIPATVLFVGTLAAVVLWYLDDTRPNLGTSASGAPRLDFEIRLPPGAVLPTPPSSIRVELNTERNRMPGRVLDTTSRQGDGRQVLIGSVELAYRSGWRLLELLFSPGGPALIFDLRLPASPPHMPDYGPWHRVDFIATRGDQPHRPGAADTHEIRTRVIYRDVELAAQDAGPRLPTKP